VFHDPVTGNVRHVNIPYAHPSAQQLDNQVASQQSTINEMVLYQQPSNQMAQHMPQIASVNQLMTSGSPQLASVAQPMVSALPQPASTANQQVDWTSKIAEVIRDQFGLRPKQQSFMYKTPYPPAYDQISLPHKYKVPDFTKFSGQGDVSMVEHVNRFIMQCGEAGNQDALRVRLFSMSLSGLAFALFTTFPTNSILYWADLEKQFHQFFYSGVCEMKLTDLTNLRQRNDESVTAFI